MKIRTRLYLLVSLLLPSFWAWSSGKSPTTNSNQENLAVSSSCSRRELFQKGFIAGASASLASTTTLPQAAIAASSRNEAREDLLQAINAGSPQNVVLNRLEALVATSTEASTLTTKSLRDKIDGQWRLIWSVGDENFSPLLQLPGILKPKSFQYAGSEAASIVGEGRIGQMLTGGILGGTKTWLSSGIVPLSDDLLEIRPPFRLEIETLGGIRQTVVEAGSDADFRAANARTQEAQQAPPNLYRQLYLEDNGPGSLRVSKIVEGDPVIVGAILIHRKL